METGFNRRRASNRTRLFSRFHRESCSIWGDHWTLDYTPTLYFYSSSRFQNTVDHSVQLGWGMAYGDWFFSGSQGFASTSDPNVETAAQTGQKTYSTALNAAYQFNDKMSLDMGLSQNLDYIGNGASATNYLQNLANSKSWSTMEWLNYQFWPRLNAGLGAGFGYTVQDGSPDSINEQYQAWVNWRATDKISFQLSGGLEDQQYLSGGASALVTPIFGATIQYQPFEQTRFSVSASRTVSPASFQNQTTKSTGISAGLNQRLLGRLYLDLSGGYNTTKFVASAFGFPPAATIMSIPSMPGCLVPCSSGQPFRRFMPIVKIPPASPGSHWDPALVTRATKLGLK